MFKSTILLFFFLNCYHCYKQQAASNDYGSSGGVQSQTISLPKPQAIIHLPDNVYAHKITDTIKLDHEQLSNYLSSINYLPDTIHKHAQLLAQLNPEDIKQYGQSIGSNQLPLISLTVPDKNSDYSSGDTQMKIAQDDYSAPQQKDSYSQEQPQSGYGQQQDSYGQSAAPQQQQQQQEYAQPKKQEYSQPPPSPMKKNCNKHSSYNQQQQSSGYGQQQNSGYSQQQSSGYGQQQGSGYGQQNSQEQYGGGNSYENNNSYEDNKPQVEYQSGGQMDNNYGSGNSYYSGNSNSYEQQGGGNSYEQQGGGNSYEQQGGGNSYEQQGGGNSYEQQGGGNSYEQQGGQSYSSNNNNQDYGKSSNEGSGNEQGGNYESSPFDYNFVQDILAHVMQQLEQLQIDPENLNAYGKTEDSNDGGYQSNNNGGGYESNNNNNNNQGGYEAQGNGQGIQLVDKPEGAQEINYGYSINHGSYEQPASNSPNEYESSYTSSSTTSQATQYSANEPAVVLDNKIPINQIDSKDQSTVTYQMPTLNIEMPKKQIEHIMKAISGKKGSSQPIMIKANQFKLPSGLNLGKIKSIAFISGSKLKGLNQLSYLNTHQLLGSNLNNYNLVSSMTKKEETSYDQPASSPSRLLSAYGYEGYGVSVPSSKLYGSSSNKKSIILPLRSRKRLGRSGALQAASSNIKKTIISAVSKSKKAATKATKAVQKKL